MKKIFLWIVWGMFLCQGCDRFLDIQPKGYTIPSKYDDYRQLMNRSMVTVTGVSSGVDWFNNVNESKNQSSGVIIAQNGKQLLILTDYSPVKQADDIIVTFNEGTQADASLKERSSNTVD